MELCVANVMTNSRGLAFTPNWKFPEFWIIAHLCSADCTARRF